MTDYVQISFKGDNGIRTVWAEWGALTPDGGKLSFWRVKRDGARPDPEEVIIGAPDKFTIRPATMNLHYGELELVRVKDDPDPYAELKARLYALKQRGLGIDDVEGIFPSGDLGRHYRRLWAEMEAESPGCPDLVQGDQDNAICPKCGMVWSPTWQEKPACKMFPEVAPVVRNVSTCVGCGRTWDPERESVPNCCHTCMASGR